MGRIQCPYYIFSNLSVVNFYLIIIYFCNFFPNFPAILVLIWDQIWFVYLEHITQILRKPQIWTKIAKVNYQNYDLFKKYFLCLNLSITKFYCWIPIHFLSIKRLTDYNSFDRYSYFVDFYKCFSLAISGPYMRFLNIFGPCIRFCNIFGPCILQVLRLYIFGAKIAIIRVLSGGTKRHLNWKMDQNHYKNFK